MEMVVSPAFFCLDAALVLFTRWEPESRLFECPAWEEKGWGPHLHFCSAVCPDVLWVSPAVLVLLHMTTPGVSKLVQQVADFHKVFQANWRQVANAKAHEKLRITNDMIHLIDEKPQPFVGFLMKGDLDVVSRLMSTMRHVSKLLGTTLPLHFHRFMAQVKDAIGEREDDQVVCVATTSPPPPRLPL